MLTLEGIWVDRAPFTLSADLSLAPGSRTAVIGPSGAGKSTLLDVIAGFLDPTAGRVRWQGRDITDDPPGTRPVSVIFQDANLFPHMDVFDNVALGIRPSGRLSRAERARVADALERVGLAGLRDRKPGGLSGGQRGRAALARMLLRARPLVLLDEPFAALGPALKAEMTGLLTGLADETGAALVMVTHDPEDARALGGQTVLVAGGTAHPPQPTGALLDAPPPELAAYLGRRGPAARF